MYDVPKNKLKQYLKMKSSMPFMLSLCEKVMEPFKLTNGVTDQYANMDILCLCVRFVDISNTKQCIIVIYTLWQVCSLMVNIVMHPHEERQKV